MQIRDNAVEAISSGREGVQSIIDWFRGNALELPVGLAVAAAIVLFMLGLRFSGAWLSSGDPDCRRWRGVIGRVLQKTSIFFMVVAALDMVANYAAVPVKIEHLLDILFTIGFAFQGAIWARELILGVITRRAGEDPTETAIGNALAVIRVLVSVTLFALAIIVILDNLGVNVTALVAGLGIGGIAIGLAAQGIFSDLFAALSILFDKPFRRGDSIRFGDVSGNVEQIGLKTTRVRSVSGEQVIVANGKLLEQQIHNFAFLDHRRVVLPLGLICQTPPELCRRLPAMLKEIVERHDKAKLVRCGMTGFGASTLDFELQFDIRSLDYDEVFRTRSEICIAILDAFNEANIQLAYPTQTSFTAAPDGSLIMPYPPAKPVEEAASAQSGHEPQGQDA
jgi:small-conductance mechanosensitive channel